ncbi:glycosyltransferase [Flavobacterium wongokense]|uniref:glycosyltransferase n=1 Tax=Flavobacterium wongokense TaxID=2910674 RepID=UPI001F23B909|nr:glycosyltransferase [Flavobacterium sp. WG47]MCF6132699.1 glycosyltransferase [Flavobacterium sp. WG47]
MKDYAPLLVMVYDRLDSLKKCITALQQCEEAKASELYISSDAAYRNQDIEKIEAVREYIQTVTGFKKVIPIAPKENRGLNGAYNAAIDLIFKEHDTFIFLEDDIIVAPDFLKFVNEGLEFYKNDPKVLSVSGFSHSVFFEIDDKSKSDVYFTNRWCPWGFASWRNKILDVHALSMEELSQDLHDKKFVRKLDKIGIDLFTAFQRKLYKNEPLVLDYRYVHYMVKNDLYAVTPYTTKTFNIGNDGQGTRTRKNEKFTSFDLETLKKIVPFRFSEFSNDKINNAFNFLTNNTRTSKLKRVLNAIGLLQFGYYLHERKKKWRKRK